MRVFVAGIVVTLACAGSVREAEGVSAADYASIQAAIDANPGQMVCVPEGDHAISKKIRIGEAGGGLCGYGRIVQSNPEEPVLEIEHASGVRIRDITLTRAQGAMEATANGLLCSDVRDASIEGVRVVDCRARDAAIRLHACDGCTVRDCEILNYKRIAVDDRTSADESLYGYAFFCIDGTGILVEESTGTILHDNRIVDRNLLPTREVKERHRLGTLTEGRHPTKPGKLGLGAVERQYVSNWHQGSAIVATSPTVTHHTSIRANYIENAAQGIDLHCDNAVVSGNTVNHGMIGLKATHGCRNLILSDNLLTHIDLWGILVNPGAGSHAAQAAAADRPAQPANVDSGIVVANNIITDYGYGNEYWNHGGSTDDLGSSYAIALFEGQLGTNPPLTDVIVTGNLVYDTGRDQVLEDSQPKTLPPRYRYAVYVGPWGTGATCPQNVVFSGNLFHPGARGVANIDLTPCSPAEQH